MWNSYQLYVSNTNLFFSCFKQWIEENNIQNTDFFYTQYLDSYGFHIRLRFKENSRIGFFISNLSCNKRQTIYDPDIIRYGKYNNLYESFSCLTSSFIITNVINESTFIRINYILFIILFLVSKNNIDLKLFLKKYPKYWSKSYKYYKSSISSKDLNKFVYQNIEHSHIKNLNNIFSDYDNNTLDQELCFYFIHMTFNRLSFNIKDEVIIIKFLKFLKGV